MKKFLSIILLSWLTTSCCKQYKSSLSQEQISKLAQELPEYPKTNTFSIQEQEYIARIPQPLKIYIFEVVNLTKCLKYNKCE